MDLLDLTVEKWVAGGRGLARLDGMAVFIPGAVPGDRVRVRITGRRRNHATAQIESLLQPSPDRIIPECPEFGVCGGCHLQHIAVSRQHIFKKDVVVDALTRIGHLPPTVPLDPVVEVSSPWNYRRKAGFKVRVVRDQVLLGFHQTGSHRVVNLNRCPVLRPELDQLIQPLRTLVGCLSIRNQVPQLDVMVGDVGVGVIMHALQPLSKKDHDLCLSLARDHLLARFDVQQGRKNRMVSLFQEKSLEYQLEGMSLKFLPADFIQVNGEGNKKLVAIAMEAAGRGQAAWDLFCGIGNFTLPLAQRFDNVLAVEGNRSSLDRLRVNCERAALDQVQTVNMDLFSPKDLDMFGLYAPPDLILLDPPRVGAVEFCKRIDPFRPKRLIYVSCDPATFSRDAAILCHGGAQLQKVVPVDLFPQTHHVELVGIFAWE